MRRLLLGVLTLLALGFATAASALPCNNYDWVPGEIRYDDGLGNCRRLVVAADGSIATTGGGGGTVVTQPTASLLNAQVVGNVASAAADSGNPVKVGGIVYTGGSLPTFSGGNRADAQFDTKGHLQVNITSPQFTDVDAFSNGGIVGLGALDGAATNTFSLMVVPKVFNGTTWDRSRSAVNATNTTGTGVSAVGLLAQVDDVSPTAITENNFGNVRMSSGRAMLTTAKPDIAGGLAPCRIITGTTGFCKAAVGQIYSCSLINLNAGIRYFHIYNKASAPTLSTDTPVMTIAMTGSSARDVQFTDIGVALSTGFAWAYTTDSPAIPTTAGTSAELIATCTYN